ncbi:MAG: MFS transporter, partial [Solirubrobacterales bacterium]|nr:MFS transporter [Solirubrobacterales bacterium]
MNRPVGRYRRLLSTPGIATIMSTGLAARLPLGIMGLALVLFVREETGSYASAGAVAAAYAVGTAVAGPFAGRLVDRIGVRAVLLPMAALNAAGTVAIVVLGSAGATVPLLVLVAAAAGGALPPVSSVIRTQLAARLSDEDELESTAFALDAVIVEIV